MNWVADTRSLQSLLVESCRLGRLAAWSIHSLVLNLIFSVFPDNIYFIFHCLSSYLEFILLKIAGFISDKIEKKRLSTM